MQDYVPQDKKLEIYIIKVLGKCNKSVLEGCCKSAIKCGCTKSDTRMYQERYFCNRNWGIFLCTLTSCLKCSHPGSRKMNSRQIAEMKRKVRGMIRKIK